MAKVITISRRFPAKHIAFGQPTHFVEKIISGLYYKDDERVNEISRINKEILNLTGSISPSLNMVAALYPKVHTIRAGERFETGEMASLRIWSGAPYKSKQVIIADVQVTTTKFRVIKRKKLTLIKIDKWDVAAFNTKTGHAYFGDNIVNEVAFNDGLSVNNFKRWFNIPFDEFTGQIICWVPDRVNYMVRGKNS